MGQPLGIVLVFMIDTKLWDIHLPVHGEKGKETKSRASHPHTSEVSIAVTTLLLLHWELSVGMFHWERVLGECWDNVASSWAALCPAPILFHKRWEGWILLETGCLYLLA